MKFERFVFKNLHLLSFSGHAFGLSGYAFVLWGYHGHFAGGLVWFAWGVGGVYFCCFMLFYVVSFVVVCLLCCCLLCVVLSAGSVLLVCLFASVFVCYCLLCSILSCCLACWQAIFSMNVGVGVPDYILFSISL